MKFMKWLIFEILERRAVRIAGQIAAHLPETGKVLDIGSGTGHNVRELSKTTFLSFFETDVVNMSLTDSRPILFDGKDLPFNNNAFSSSLMLFMLHYVEEPALFLKEVHRITSGKVILVQSVYNGRTGLLTLKYRELVQGRSAFHVCKCPGLLKNCPCSLFPVRYFTRNQLSKIIFQTGFSIAHFDYKEWPGLSVSRDLYILEKYE